MNMKKLILLTTLTVSLFAISSEEVAKKSYDVISGYRSSLSKTTMILKNAQGVENVRKLEMKKIEGADGDKSLLNFLYPDDLKDTKLLSFEVIGGDDKQWLYLPSLKRIKRISSRNKSGSFMASEFSYEDISSQNYKNYSYSGEAEEVTREGEAYYQVTRIPIDANSGYSKQVVWVEKSTFLAKYGEYYDKQNRLLKKINFSEYRVIDGIQRIVKIEIENVQNGKSSSLIWDEDAINAGIKSNELSKRALK
jgi:outer membrane lipoprotein-sorting protein